MYTADTTNIQIGTYIYQKVQRQENDLSCYARVHTSVEEAPSPPRYAAYIHTRIHYYIVVTEVSILPSTHNCHIFPSPIAQICSLRFLKMFIDGLKGNMAVMFILLWDAFIRRGENAMRRRRTKIKMDSRKDGLSPPGGIMTGRHEGRGGSPRGDSPTPPPPPPYPVHMYDVICLS